MTDDAARTRRGIQSLETGLGVLQALAALKGPAALSAVAARAGISASQAHRYLASLIAAGMARQEPGTGHYDLAAGAIRLGLAALARIRILELADQAFAAFARRTGRTCLVAVWGDAGATVVRWFPGDPPVITSLAIGSVLPLRHSATGHVFLAYGDPSVAHGAEPALAESVRREGLARVDATLIPGLRATAMPVLDLQGRLALVATALATPAFDPTGDAAAEAALREACREISEAIGGR